MRKKDKQQALWWQPALVLFVKLSGWIAFPIIISIFIGKWLDKKYASDPWLFLMSVGIAFLISIFGLARNAMREIRKIERNDKKV